MSAELAPFVEIACDESGSEGEKLIGGNTNVFAHASVALDVAAAAACVQEARDRIRSPAVEYKANHLLRQKHRAALVWLLDPSGPIFGKARVYLAEKAFVLVSKVTALALGEGSADHALLLHRAGPDTFGRADWQAFLETSNAFLWIRNDQDSRPSADAYFRLIDRMRDASRGSPIGDVLDLIWESRHALAARTSELAAPPLASPVLDPLVPALVRAIESWVQDGRPVSIVHDEQSRITGDVITELIKSSPHLASLRLVDSMDDPRIQVADFLAGVARRIAEDELTGRGDAELTTLLRPYVDPLSLWGDARSWASLN